MSWQPYTLFFRQTFENGYRYLDRCGEFIQAAVSDFGFLVSEVKPTGARLAIPEDGIKASVDANSLEVRQEAPISDPHRFLELSITFADLAEKMFGPLMLSENLFQSSWYLERTDPEHALKSTIALPVDPKNEYGDAFGMIPEQKHFDTTFRSGSRLLQIQIQPVTFDSVTIQRKNPAINSNSSAKNRARRLTMQAERIPKFPAYCVMLEATVAEEEPPGLTALEDQFEMLVSKTEIAKKLFSPK